MRTPASIKGHPLHVMVIPLPLGLWIFSWVADLIYISGWGERHGASSPFILSVEVWSVHYWLPFPDILIFGR